MTQQLFALGGGKFFSQTGNVRGRDVLLAILFIPVVFPLLYAVTAATTTALVGDSQMLSIYTRSLVLAGGYDLIMIAVSWLLYDFVISS